MQGPGREPDRSNGYMDAYSLAMSRMHCEYGSKQDVCLESVPSIHRRSASLRVPLSHSCRVRA